LLGCQSWDELNKTIIEECKIKGWISPQLYDEYLIDKDKKRVLQKCRIKFIKNNEEPRYFDLIRKSCKGKQELIENYNIYDELKQIPAKYASTNFDLLFANKFIDKYVIYKNNEFDPDMIKRGVLYQIHGSLKDNNSIVLTTLDYTTKYNIQNYLNFLKKFFNDNLLLFIGYGLEEMEILIPFFNKVINKSCLRSYLLQGYNKKRAVLLQDNKDYYACLGVELIPFDCERLGYNLLFNIIGYWHRKIQKNCDVIYNDLNQIERLVK